MNVTNIFDGISQHLSSEVIETLVNAPGVRIERIVSHGQNSPDAFWYDQEQDEWVILLQGAARVQFEVETIDLKPGDYISIPAHKRHRVEWTTPDAPTVWLAVHYRH